MFFYKGAIMINRACFICAQKFLFLLLHFSLFPNNILFSLTNNTNNTSYAIERNILNYANKYKYSNDHKDCIKNNLCLGIQSQLSQYQYHYCIFTMHKHVHSTVKEIIVMRMQLWKF